MGAEGQAISGRRYFEERAKRSVVSYAYDYLGATIHAQLMPLLRSKDELTVSYLNDETGDMVTETMFVESYTRPTFAFSDNGTGRWHNYSFVLKGVYPLAD
jgi:hypothetical protein